MALLSNTQQYQEFAKYEDFKDLYKDMLEASRKPNKDGFDKLRASKLALKVDEAFDKYKPDEKLDAIRYLAKHDLVPQAWIEFQEAVKGEYKNITKDSNL